MTGLFYEFGGNPIRAKNYAAVVEEQVGADLAPRVLEQYPLYRFGSAARAASAVVTDGAWGCPARFVDQLLASQVPTFAYEFNDADAPQVFLPPASASVPRHAPPTTGRSTFHQCAGAVHAM